MRKAKARQDALNKIAERKARRKAVFFDTEGMGIAKKTKIDFSLDDDDDDLFSQGDASEIGQTLNNKPEVNTGLFL